MSIRWILGIGLGIIGILIYPEHPAVSIWLMINGALALWGKNG